MTRSIQLNTPMLPSTTDVLLAELGGLEIVVCNEVLYCLDEVPKQLDPIRDLLSGGVT
jgi:hypothetical protein